MAVIRYASLTALDRLATKAGLFLVCTLFGLPLCAQAPFSGGATTLQNPQSEGRDVFTVPAVNLSVARKDQFFVGNAFFRNPWQIAPGRTRARDGLGPLFNTDSCIACHERDGRGRPPVGNDPLTTMTIKLAVPFANESDHQVLRLKEGVLPDKNYGVQLQNRAIPGVPPEAAIRIEWIELQGSFDDGSSYTLVQPKYHLEQLAYGELEPKTALSGRVAPAIVGLGLLEAISHADLEAREDPNDEDQDGISGRLNRVWDRAKMETVVGRFGWKAAEPNVRQQIAAAFSEDLGVTSTLFDASVCRSSQQQCLGAPHGGQPEVSERVLDFLTFYSKVIAVPARRNVNHPDVVRGESLFKEIGCIGCHVETWVTGVDAEVPELNHQEIHPYTDLMLHDMGPGLADNRSEFQAEGYEWRTPPLWGIGLIPMVNQHTRFLHDGRARSLEEAILWHGGEAASAQAKYVHLDKADRNALLTFLNSL